MKLENICRKLFLPLAMVVAIDSAAFPVAAGSYNSGMSLQSKTNDKKLGNYYSLGSSQVRYISRNFNGVNEVNESYGVEGILLAYGNSDCPPYLSEEVCRRRLEEMRRKREREERRSEDSMPSSEERAEPAAPKPRVAPESKRELERKVEDYERDRSKDERDRSKEYYKSSSSAGKSHIGDWALIGGGIAAVLLGTQMTINSCSGSYYSGEMECHETKGINYIMYAGGAGLAIFGVVGLMEK